MTMRQHNPASLPPPRGGYSQAIEVAAGARLLFISGQIPEGADGSLPADFAGQCHAVWDHIEALLAAAAMTMAITDLVKVTTYLTDRAQAGENREIRQRRLAGASPALTVIVAQTLESRWLLEIEAIAAREEA